MPERYRLARAEELKRWAKKAGDDLVAVKEATAIIGDFNNRLTTGQTIWAWPTIGAALTAKHPWAEILCESCEMVSGFDMRVKPRDPRNSIRVILKDVRCPRCNGHGRPRILRLR